MFLYSLWTISVLELDLLLKSDRKHFSCFFVKKANFTLQEAMNE
jgi:hypothetical protein